MTSLIVRNIFFTILQPGIVVGLIPLLILHYSDELKYELTSVYHYMGILIFAFGFIILLKCIYDFASHGKGTLSPADPTKKLVVRGLYRFSRNPMYVGVIILLIGEVVFTKSIYMFIYTLFIFIGFHMFIKYKEEPRLIKDFGDGYLNYCKQVKRWF